MTVREPSPPLPDNFLRGLHLAEFAAGFVSPEGKALLEKVEQLLPDILRDGGALMADLVRLWPAVEPVVHAIGAHMRQGASVDHAVAAVRTRTAALLPVPDQQGGGR